MWSEKSISIATKMKLYHTLVVTVLVFGSECWSLRKEDEIRLLVAEMSWLRRIRGRSRRNEHTREEPGAHSGTKDQGKETTLAWTRGTDGGEQTTKCSFTWTCEGKEKQREAEEDLYGQCQGRPKGETHRLDHAGLVKRPETERSGGAL